MACVALRDSVRALAKSCAAGGVHVPGAVVAMRELVHARAESAAAAAARDKADALALEEARALPQADAAEFPNFAAVSVAAVPLVVAGRRDDGGSATVLSSRVVAGAGVVYDVQYAVGGASAATPANRARGDAVRTEAGAAALAETSYTSGVLAGAEERDADALAVRDQAARDRAHDRAALEADVARAREVAVEAERGREREQTARTGRGLRGRGTRRLETALAERDALMQRSLSGIVDFLMPSGDGGALTKIRSFDAPPDAVGADDTSRRQADYIRAAMRCFDGLADLLSGGDAERLEVVFGAFDASMAKRRRVRGASERVLVALKDNIATAWQNHTQVGDYTAATQVGCFDVRPLPTTGSGRLICFVEDRVPADRVRHADSLICTKHDVQTAANLAMDRFPGARRDVISRSGWTRIGIERAALTAAFLRDPSVVVQADGGASTARRKTKWFLKEGVPRLLKRLNRRLADAGLRRSSEAHFRGLLAGPGYAKLTAELCTCVKCRDLGFVVYDLLRSVVAACSFSISVSIQERLYNQIDAEERFRSGEFRSHLKEESHVAQHCLCYLLSSENEPCFREPCVHGRKDGSTLSPPKTMEEIVAPRRLTRRDHEDECMVCYGDEGSLLCCAVVAKSDVDLRAYHGHIAQDVCTTPYQKFATPTLKDHEYTTIYDYWAKQSAKLHMEGTCEGQGNKGVSCSGRAFTCNNPTSATRAQYPDVPWAIFPSSPDQGGPAPAHVPALVVRQLEAGQLRHGRDALRGGGRVPEGAPVAHDERRRDMSDGASNFRSTPAALYNMQSPYPTYKATSVSGHGKDVVDADNGVEQPKLRAPSTPAAT
ncbi:diazepam binding inhibitor, acyl-CoA binding protein [Aureococcus anophagefferens]|uniref:Diazepam binding inhibitor, acyl-CoA binding protein n=1 Tax=Aureococcus anophagefferens TaxID=44056 RepID=A0ABR1FXC4_AURAN